MLPGLKQLHSVMDSVDKSKIVSMCVYVGGHERRLAQRLPDSCQTGYMHSMLCVHEERPGHLMGVRD